MPPPGSAINPVPSAGSPQFPTLINITTADLVGPFAANRQHTSNESRTNSLRTTLNEVVAAINDAYFGGPLDTPAFLPRSGAHPMVGVLRLGATRTKIEGVDGLSRHVLLGPNDTGTDDDQILRIQRSADNQYDLFLWQPAGPSNVAGLYRVLTTRDLGAGGGIDADTLDGIDSSQFVRNDLGTLQTITNKLASALTLNTDGGETLTTKSYVDAQIAAIPTGGVGGGILNMAVFTSGASWPVPPNARRVKVTVVGGGGAGTVANGGPGGAGGAVVAVFSVDGTETATIAVGSGGAYDNAAPTGANGGNSTLTLPGGKVATGEGGQGGRGAQLTVPVSERGRSGSGGNGSAANAVAAYTLPGQEGQGSDVSGDNNAITTRDGVFASRGGLSALLRGRGAGGRNGGNGSGTGGIVIVEWSEPFDDFDILTASTTEANSNLVLKPNGAGGVEWGALPVANLPALSIGGPGVDGSLSAISSSVPQYYQDLTISSSILLNAWNINVLVVRGNFTVTAGGILDANLGSIARKNQTSVASLDPYSTLYTSRLGTKRRPILAAGSGSEGCCEGAGGGGYGNGGFASNGNRPGGQGWNVALPSNLWKLVAHLVSGSGSSEGHPTVARGGGSLLIFVEGNVDVSGIIRCNGQNGPGGFGGVEGGGGGGGSILIYSLGTVNLANATLQARGGNGFVGFASGGGGGGYIGIVAPTIVSPTLPPAVNGGARGNAGGQVGGMGLYEEVVLAAPLIRDLVYAP